MTGPTAATEALATVRALLLPALGPRVRLRRDTEGWPVAPGRSGRLEWRGLAALLGLRTTRALSSADARRLGARTAFRAGSRAQNPRSDLERGPDPSGGAIAPPEGPETFLCP